MRSLRSRLALLLVVAIIGVVALAACVSILVLERPDRESFRQTFAEEVRIIATVLVEDPNAAERLGITVGSAPVGNVDDDDDLRVRQSYGIGNELRNRGLDIDVRIVADLEGRTRQIAFEYAPGRWAYLPYPGFPPHNWLVFVFYMAVVVIGATGVSLYAATKMTRPLKILDLAVSSVGRDGLPAHVPEDGPAEMRATAAALNRLTARVREAVESRMRLVAAAGHDLRTPMTRMRLRAEFLPDEDREVWLKDLAELDRIADSAIRLVREEVDETSVEDVPLGAMIREIVGELNEIGRDVTVAAGTDRIRGAVNGTGPTSPITRARPLALKRALRNLVDNAAVHGGGARVQLTSDKDAAIVTIADDGPGIPEDLIGRAFEPFFRVDPGRRQFKPGAGLGMAIAKEIVDQAGGSIIVANRKGGGLDQTIRLPLSHDIA